MGLPSDSVCRTVVIVSERPRVAVFECAKSRVDLCGREGTKNTLVLYSIVHNKSDITTSSVKLNFKGTDTNSKIRNKYKKENDRRRINE